MTASQALALSPDRNPTVPVAKATRRSRRHTVVDMMGRRRTDTLDLEPLTIAIEPAAGVTAMIHPSEPELSRPLAVRGGQGAPVTCATCGCRLSQAGEAWFHFHPLGGRDARGCRVDCVDAAHDASGRAVSIAV